MFIDKVVLVVAHPDDEVLWFSSILQACKRFWFALDPPTMKRLMPAGLHWWRIIR